MNIKITYIVLTTSAPVFYCFNNTQGTDRDHFLTHKSQVLGRKKKKKGARHYRVLLDGDYNRLQPEPVYKFPSVVSRCTRTREIIACRVHKAVPLCVKRSVVCVSFIIRVSEFENHSKAVDKKRLEHLPLWGQNFKGVKHKCFTVTRELSQHQQER